MTIRLRQLLRSRLFLTVLVLKIVFLFSGAAEVPRNLLLPFLDRAVQAVGENPWALGPAGTFPYGGFLFLALFIPKWILFQLFGTSALGMEPLSLFALKAPLLAFDLLFFWILCVLVPTRRRDLTMLYWANPILFYINSIHGQLDVVSMALCALSLLFLIRERVLLSALVFGLATASKFHVVAAVPFLLVYIWHKEFRAQAWRQVGGWVAMWFAVSLVGLLPVFAAGGLGGASVQSPEILRLFAAELELSQHLAFYVGLFGTLLVLARLIVSTDITEVGLLMGTGLLFSALVFFSNSAPGWYYWSVPFLAVFFSLYLNAPRILLAAVGIAYLAFFGLNDFVAEFATSNKLFMSVLFTSLQSGLLACIGFLWTTALKNEVRVFNRLKPLRIGIAGDSGAGKNTLTSSLEMLFGRERMTLIEGDNYHKWERGDDNWSKYTHLNPKANHVFSMFRHTASLSQGRPILYSEYSHESGRFQPLQELRPSRTLVVQGLHTFFLRGMRQQFDLKVYMNPDPMLRRAWKVRRDCLERGYSKDKVLAQLQNRASDSEAYIQSQKAHADVIVEFRPATALSEAEANEGVVPPLVVSVTVWNDFDLAPVVDECERQGVRVDVTIPREDVDRVTMTFAQEPPQDNVARVAHGLFPKPRRFTRGMSEPQWMAGYYGVLQIVMLQALRSRSEINA